MATNPKPPKLSASDKAFRRATAIAVLGGIYAHHGCDILDMEEPQRSVAIRGASRVAMQQADELLRRERESEQQA